MRLIHANTLQLHEFHGEDIPPYAILSHTWGDQEVTFQDWQDQAIAATKDGFAKITGACSMASCRGLQRVWVDTNCIDKTSSAELTEAINSMFTYYRRAEVCFAYLSDVPSACNLGGKSLRRQVRNSRWFTRGWTPQELLAPKELVFYAGDWSRIGRRNTPSLANWASQATGIEKGYLDGLEQVDGACISKKNVLARQKNDDSDRRYGILHAWYL